MVLAKNGGHLVVEMKVRSHQMVSGAAVAQGGQDEGPNAHEILEAALAACTNQTVQMYASRKGWPVKDIKVKVQIVSENREETRISREVSFEGDLTEEQRQRLLEIANKCPIHRMFEHPIHVETKVGDGF